VDNPVIFVSSRANSLNVLLALLVENTHLPLRFRQLKYKQKQHKAILLFKKQLLFVFNVGKNKTACCILTFICNTSNSINTKLSKVLRNDKITFCIIAN
jgi:hypothetical protein